MVIAIVQHINSGKPDYRLYKRKGGFTSQRTLNKIRELWADGKLDPLLDVYHMGGLFDRAIESDGKNTQTVKTLADGWGTRGLDVPLDTPPFGKPPPYDPAYLAYGQVDDYENRRAREWREDFITGIDGHRFKVVEKAEGLTDKEWTWSIDHLEALDIPGNVALDILKKYDRLRIVRELARAGQWPLTVLDSPYLRNFRGLEQYVALHYLIVFKKKYHQAPLDYIRAAANIYAKGELTSDSTVSMAGEDLLRYGFWKGSQYVEAYDVSLTLRAGSPKRLRKLKAMINDLLLQLSYDLQEQYGNDPLEAMDTAEKTLNIRH